MSSRDIYNSGFFCYSDTLLLNTFPKLIKKL